MKELTSRGGHYSNHGLRLYLRKHYRLVRRSQKNIANHTAAPGHQRRRRLQKGTRRSEIINTYIWLVWQLAMRKERTLSACLSLRKPYRLQTSGKTG